MARNTLFFADGFVQMKICYKFKPVFCILVMIFLLTASYGELRRGDKVLLLEKGTDGVIKSAIFKGRRIGRSDEPEIILVK